ncbi:hypothetical protein ES705_23377 [subsurface metagenome]
MSIGTFIIEAFGDLKGKQSIDLVKNIMHPLLLSVSDHYDFDYKRFEYLSGRLIWVIPIKSFWKNDRIISTLRKSISLYFNNWNFTIYLLIHETGGE